MLKNNFSKFLSVLLIFVLVAGFFAPLQKAQAATLSITCDTVSVSGNTWTLSGTWSGIDFQGQSNQYDVAVFSPTGTLNDSSSKDSPDTFLITQGPAKLPGVGEENKDDMSGSWSNQITFLTSPASISAAIYHGQVPGNEISGDAACTFDINDAPVLSGVPSSATTPELSLYTFTATATDVDLPAQTLSYSLTSAPAGATIGSTSGLFSWTPTEAQGPGTYTFSVNVTDGMLTTSQSVTITVSEVNTAPVASNSAISTPMNTAQAIILSATDVDVPPNTLNFSIVTNPTKGTLSAVTGNSVTYTPNNNYVGADSFTYKANDGTTDSNIATVSITVSNNAPVITPITDKTISEGSNLSFTATATDPNSNPVTYSIANAPSGSTFNTTTGEFSFTPSEAQGGMSYVVTISATDGAATDSTTFTITVTEVNNMPTADNKSVSTDEDTAVVVTLSGSDTDLPAQTLTFALGTAPTNGTLNILGNQATYTPNTNYNGSDSFTYTVSDGTATSAPATVSITINPINDAPAISGVPNESTLDELTNLSFTATGSDVDGNTLTFSLVGAPSGASIDPQTGAFSWTPTEAQGPGNYSFDIQVHDGTVYTSVPVNVTVQEVNLAPVASSLSVTTAMNTPVTITLSATDADFPVQTLVLTVGNPSQGTLTDIGGNQFTYTPSTDFVGSDSFTYTANDGVVDGNTATVSITVSNEAPVLAEIQAMSTDEETPFSFNAQATDPNSDELTYSLTGTVPNGASIDPQTGAFSWTPSEEQGPGVYVFNVTVTDGAATDSKSVSITVNEVNKTPTAQSGSVSTNEDTVVIFNLTGADADLPAQVLSFLIGTTTTKGTLGLSGSQVTYTPNANYNGSDSFTFMTNDGAIDSEPATFDITINPVNDSPNIELNGAEEVVITTGGSFNDEGAMCTDLEDENIEYSVSGEIDTNKPGTYTLSYNCTDSGEQTSETVTRTVIVQEAPAMCADGIDNDQDGKIDFGGENGDPGCSGSDDNNETDPVVSPVSAPGSVIFPPSTPASTTQPQGEVLGATTEACEIYAKKFMRRGYKNNPDEVKKLQSFLNDFGFATLPVTGVFGVKTEQGVKAFQLKYKDEILTPWNISKPTGIAYLTTLRHINKLKCPDLDLPLPTLVPFSNNPETPKP